jgi:putative transcriptional regulator
MTESLRGHLLVASPSLLDPNFRRTVVLLLEDDDEGAVGLVLNRPSETTVGEAVPPLAELADAEDLVAVGGPVQPEAVSVLAEWDDPDAAGSIVFEDVGPVPAEADLDGVLSTTRRRRVFAGYAGWSPGQLRLELGEPSWIVARPRPDDVFDTPRDLWASVLRRKGGEYRLLATMPENPSLN